MAKAKKEVTTPVAVDAETLAKGVTMDVFDASAKTWQKGVGEADQSTWARNVAARAMYINACCMFHNDASLTPYAMATRIMRAKDPNYMPPKEEDFKLPINGTIRARRDDLAAMEGAVRKNFPLVVACWPEPTKDSAGKNVMVSKDAFLKRCREIRAGEQGVLASVEQVTTAVKATADKKRANDAAEAAVGGIPATREQLANAIRQLAIIASGMESDSAVTLMQLATAEQKAANAEKANAEKPAAANAA